MEYETTVFIDSVGGDVDVTVDYSICGAYHPASSINPADYPEVEIESVLDADGNDYIDEVDHGSLTEDIMEYQLECGDDARHEAEIDRHQERMEREIW